MTDFEKQYLKDLRNQGSFTLEGNREYWEKLIFSGSKIWHVFGDTMENRETSRREIAVSKALLLIKEHFLQKNDFYKISPEKISLEDIFRKINEKYGTDLYDV